jgi:RNA polymerase sigma-70 factor, ECF subfamily
VPVTLQDSSEAPDPSMGPLQPTTEEAATVQAVERRSRLERALESSFDLVWRTLRGLGVREGAVDDAAQQVYCVLARRLDSIEPGRERSFLVQTAIRVAYNCRRSARRQREAPAGSLDDRNSEIRDPEQLLVHKQRCELLEKLLGTLPAPLRTVFVLFELEGLSSPEIAAVVEVPRGTVVSRLRRARVAFADQVARLQSRIPTGGCP